MPVRLLATAGTVAHCTQAEALIDGIPAEHLPADRGYDTNLVLAAAREYDAALYPGASSSAEWIWEVEGVARRRVMRRMWLPTWRYARYAPWHCGLK